MEHALHVGKVLQNLHGVAVGFPLVDDHRALKLPGKTQLHAKGALLDRPGDVLIVVVQADFPDGHHLLLLGKLAVEGDQPLVHMVGVVRVGAHRGVDEVVALGEGDGGEGRG